MICDNFVSNNENFNEKCRYFEALIGTGEELPTGCDESTGVCNVNETYSGKWDEAEFPEDCDMLDLVEEQ